MSCARRWPTGCAGPTWWSPDRPSPERLLRVAVLQGRARRRWTPWTNWTASRRWRLASARPARVLLRRLPPGPPQQVRLGRRDPGGAAALRRRPGRRRGLQLPSVRLRRPATRRPGRAVGPGLPRRPGAGPAPGPHQHRRRLRGGLRRCRGPAPVHRRRPARALPRRPDLPRRLVPVPLPVAGADALRAILAAVPAGERDSLAGLLRAAGVRLLVEPGRALLDQAGCTVFAVQCVKDRDGYAILTVDGTSLSLSEQWFGSESRRTRCWCRASRTPAPPRDRTPPAGRGQLPGVRHADLAQVPFPVRPAVGDLLVYLNTAGYQMDSNESPFHELPLPPKVVVEQVSDGTAARLRWHLDRHRREFRPMAPSPHPCTVRPSCAGSPNSSVPPRCSSCAARRATHGCC